MTHGTGGADPAGPADARPSPDGEAGRRRQGARLSGRAPVVLTLDHSNWGEILRALLDLSRAIDATLRSIALAFGWLFLLLTVVICFDVITRGGVTINLPFTDNRIQLIKPFQLSLLGIDLGSSRLQELQWHLHGMLFLTWIGYAYIRNAHVRIDIVTASLSQRKQAWLELIGCIVFALPYVVIALPNAWQFFWTSLLQNEGSSAPNGLPARYVIKFFLFFAFVSVLLAVISVAARRIVYLFGSRDLSEAAMPTAPAAH